MAGETLTASLLGIVRAITTKSFTYFTADGALKNTVTQVGKGQKGSSVNVPIYDPTTITGTAGTEGTAITTYEKLLTSQRAYTETEWVVPTFITYDDYEDLAVNENLQNMVAETHAGAQAWKIESKIVTTFASFSTNTITATSTAGLTWKKIRAGVTLLEGIRKRAPKPYYLVVPENAWYWFTAGIVGAANYEGTALEDAIVEKIHVGSVAGADVLTTPAISASSAAVCGMYSREGIGLFMPRDLKYRTQEIVNKRGYDIYSSVRAGARVHIEPYGVKYTLYAANPS